MPLMLLIALIGYSQEQTNPRLENVIAPAAVESNSRPERIVQKNTTVTISKRAGEDQQLHDDAYYLKEIEKINNHLAAIQIKTDYVNADPAEKAIAESEGWFVDMENVKNQLLQKKAALEIKLNK